MEGGQDAVRRHLPDESVWVVELLQQLLLLAAGQLLDPLALSHLRARNDSDGSALGQTPAEVHTQHRKDSYCKDWFFFLSIVFAGV